MRRFALPHFYKPTPSSAWAPIDTGLSGVPGRAGWSQSGANAWSASFGPAGSTGGGEQIRVKNHQVGFSAVGATDPAVAPVVSGSTATYVRLWPHTDVVDQVTAGGVVEDIVLAEPGAPSQFSFDLSGATAKPERGGGLSVRSGSTVLGVIPPPRVSLAKPDAANAGGGSVTARSGASYSVAAGRVTVSVSPSWLASLPKDSYPVVIDPTFQAFPQANQVESFAFDGSASYTQAQVGRGSSTWAAAANIPITAPPAVQPGQQPWEVAIARFVAAPCASLPCPSGGGNVFAFGNEYLYGETGQPTSFNQVFSGQALSYTAGLTPDFLSVDISPWVSSHPSGGWFGISADVISIDGTGNQTATTAVLPAVDIELRLTYYQQPPPPPISSPTSGAVVSTATPTLTATPTDTFFCPTSSSTTTSNGVTCDDPPSVTYDFRISTAPAGAAGQTVADSGWIPQPYTTSSTRNPDGSFTNIIGTPTWTVPAGSLVDGVTYYATVQDSNSDQNPMDGTPLPPAAALPAVRFTVKQRLGAGGPSPTDTVGTPPGQTNTPSRGAPNPGTTPASATVNMVTGNLALSVNPRTLATLAGAAGVSLTYNSVQSATATGGTASGSGYGLSGSYYLLSTPPYPYAFPSGSPLAIRVDPSINIYDPTASPPIGALNQAQPYMVRWTGSITLPAGTWQLGGQTSGGMRIYLGGSSTPVYDDWNRSTTSQALGFGTTSLAGAQRYQIEVDSWEDYHTAPTTMQLWANNITSPSRPLPAIVPSTWLVPQAAGLPPGWTIDSTAAAWTTATDLGTQVVIHSPSGATEAFLTTGPGTYRPASGVTDYLADVGGHLQLSTPNGQLYRFSNNGSLMSVTSTYDDLHPSALVHTYAPTSSAIGAPVVLQGIKDPVSNRSITLSYGTSTACSSPNSAGLLCGIAYWDGTSTSVIYNSNNQLAEVISSDGNTTLFGYDASNRLNDIRDALANDYIAAAQPGSSACPPGAASTTCPFDTTVSYNASGRVAQIMQPQPTNGALRPARAYAYTPSGTTPGAGSTSVSLAGFNPPATGGSPAGVSSTITYDAQSRITSQMNSAGQQTHTVWDNQDRPIISVDTAGLQSSTVYDIDSNVTDTYGPAPTACFDPATMPTGVTATSPVAGYLPLANASTAGGCNTVVAHKHAAYDQGLAGLADTYWSDGQYAGQAATHGTGNGGTPNTTCIGFANHTDGNSSADLCAVWPSGSTPPNVSTDAANQWSLKLTGNISLPTAGDWIFCVGNTLDIVMSIDGAVAANNFTYDSYGNKTGDTAVSCQDAILTSGVHKVELDVQGSPAHTSYYNVAYVPPGGGFASIEMPLSMLSPAYGLTTSTTDADGKTTATSYTATNLGAEYGLPTAVTVGAGTPDALTTTTSYETPSATTFLRKTSRTLPAGSSTTYTYYAGTDGPLAAACGVAAITPQGGQLQAQIDPAPSAGAPSREQQFLYDAAGRQVGRRVGQSDTISNAAWQCTYYDSRGRITSQSWPAFNGAAARLSTYSYAVGGNPLASSVADSNGTISTVVDLLGRLTSYQDSVGQTTAVTYNQAGQVTEINGPRGDILSGYDATSGQPTTVTVNGTLLATATYDPATGRPTAVTYSNGTTGTFAYDTVGNQSGLTFTNTSTGALVAGDQLTRSPAGRVTSERQDINGTSLTNANPAGQTSTDYTYDGAGRLTDAYLAAGHATYSYGPNPTGDACASPGQGADTNRTSVTTTSATGTTTTDSCYNNADQLTKTISSATANTQFSYDAHGNQTNDAGNGLTWDASDRLATATKASTATTYAYDALDRVVGHTAATSTVHYAYDGYTDSPAAVLDTNNAVLQRFVALPGGVLVTTQSAGNIWSYPDLRGNYTVTATNTGTLQASPDTYDPWGQPTPGQPGPGNAAGPSTLSAFGSAGKLTDSTTGITILGARPYSAAEARFLSVDPIEGGCANAYAYAFGDPLTQKDLSGQKSKCWDVTASKAISVGQDLVEGATFASVLDKLADFGGPLGAVLKVVLALGEVTAKEFGEELINVGSQAEAYAKTFDDPNVVGMVRIKVPYPFGFPFGIPSFEPFARATWVGVPSSKAPC